MPVGVKNPTSGNIVTMTESIRAIGSPSHYSITSELFRSTGNPLAHGILRGGANGPNYYEENIETYIRNASGIENPGLVIDCNHANSGKDPFRQISVIEDLYRTILPSLERR